ALELAEWTSGLRAADIPAAASEAACRAFLDTAGVILAGATDDLAPVMKTWVAERPRPGGAIVPPFGLPTDPETAALALGALAHALDFDDIHPALLGHPSAVLVPVILSLGPAARATGEQALGAYVAGAELVAHLGRAVAPLQYRRGWHTTATIGVLGAAATAARLLRLPAPAAAHALGLAASTAAGLRANFGSHAKPLHAGQAAAHGVTAALLAGKGLGAAPEALEGPLGYLTALAGDMTAAARVPDSLGSRWELVEPGLQIKLYACCGGAHRPIDGLLDLVREQGLRPEAVEEVRVLTDPVVPTLLVYPAPATVAEARFSLQYCLAAVLADGALSLEHFTPDALARPDLRALGRRIRMEVNPALADHKGELAFAEVEVRTRDGARLTQRVDYPRGSGQRPLSRDELVQKFLGCARLYAPAHDWSPAVQAILDLGQPRGSVTDVVKALTAE
ncbi:MAG TPA: MmgE/PrpD family protein, partial [Candidatus Sulfotelmatobacter sp.]|nr:MmgE/PrpD family protein [Candidatus Sulfotelmatobacter sp.]